ncbi:hypothetical protein B0H13DRAFT_1953098 [Mycena leptocephala]|nr:hypothetical protein B0H13DRAFT_1953098 [Mycena leptocephala]
MSALLDRVVEMEHTMSQTTRTALKNHGATLTSSATTSSPLMDSDRLYRTPRRAARYSVTFSDGKREGPIRGLSILAPSESLGPESELANNDGANNATRFLTDCPFVAAHDRLMTALVDILSTANLSGRRLESVARLEEFLPALVELNLNRNQLSWLHGVPEGVRKLSVVSNRLTALTSYSHLLNLVNLDISRNQVDSLLQLSCLRHLRELRADGNAIASVEGLERMEQLVKLSLKGNVLQKLELDVFRWRRLEMLDISRNRLERVCGLAGLQALIALNVDDNQLVTFDAGGAIPQLRILRASGNQLRALHVHCFTGLRTLYADGNALERCALHPAGCGANGAQRLENLSLRTQAGRGLSLDFLVHGEVRDAKRLYLSGNALPVDFLASAHYNLVYLELANCRLSALPPKLAALTPNLRSLNLNYNLLEDIQGLADFSRLRKLSVVGARLKDATEIIGVVRSLVEVDSLDFRQVHKFIFELMNTCLGGALMCRELIALGSPLTRFMSGALIFLILRMNPCTMGWYLPLPLGKGEEPWAKLDDRFRRRLPNAVYTGRLAYRGLIIRRCSRLRVLDGVIVTQKERTQTRNVLVSME